MKNLILTRKNILGVALLTAFVGAPLMMSAPAGAAPDADPRSGSNDKRRGNDDDRRRNEERRDEERRDDSRRDNRDVSSASYRTYRGTVEVLLPGNEFNARVDGRIYKVYATESMRDLRVGDDVSIYGQLENGVNIRNARVTADANNRRDNRGGVSGRDNRDNRGGFGGIFGRDDRDSRPDYTNGRYDPNGKLGGAGNRGSYRPGDYLPDFNRPNNNRRDFNTYVGEVTNIKNSREFDARVNGRTYNVISDNTLRDLRRGDRVSVYGTRSGDNDIRDARVTVTRDRFNDDRDRSDNRDIYGSFRTYNGIVTDVRSSREFDVRVDGRTYNVTADDATRGLNRGDEVRIYGRNYGANDIRNANVRLTRDR